MSLRSRIQNEDGTMLMACSMMALLVAGGLAMYSWHSWYNSRADVRMITGQQALNYADSGVSCALSWLRRPTSGADLPTGGSYTFNTPFDNGRVEVTMIRTADVDLVDAYTTGYYYVSRSKTVD